MELLTLMLLTIVALVALSYAALHLATDIKRQRTQQLIALRARIPGNVMTGKRQDR